MPLENSRFIWNVLAFPFRLHDSRDGVVLTASAREIPLKIDTLCVHGDTPGAAELVKRIRVGLQAAGIQVRPL